MPTDIPLRCACGVLRGVASALSPTAGTRLVCYCADCQAFARFLGRPDILDERGGTEIFQTAPARVRLTAGAHALRCVRLSASGMHRWYCGECKTPVGNTLGPRAPFVGLIERFMDLSGAERDQALGPPLIHASPEAASAPVPPCPHDQSALRVMARSARFLAYWWLTGASSPSPFFDQHKQPASAPHVLTPAERSAL